MTSRRAPHIVSASPVLRASPDHCPATLDEVSLTPERERIAREEAWRDANYFKSLRKVGIDTEAVGAPLLHLTNMRAQRSAVPFADIADLMLAVLEGCGRE
jgi:hypothetical protein